MRSGRRWGFTLIELLVVIAIITILVSMIVALVVNVQRNAQVAETMAAVNAIAMAINSYKADFGTLPPIHIAKGTWPDGSTKASPSVIERNEMLYAYLTLKIKLGTKTFGPWLPEESAKLVKDTNKNGKQEFVDSWEFPLVFNMPGTDHSSDVDGDGKPRPGMDNTVLELSAGAWDQPNLKFDLYSFGPNNVDDTGAATAAWSLFAKAGGSWGYTSATVKHDHGDDIGSWGEAFKKRN